MTEFLVCAFILLACTANYSYGRMCLQCTDAIQPRHCHTITYCAEDEVCFVEKVMSQYGVRYNSGCMLKQVCEARNSTNAMFVNGDGNLRDFMCSQCCESDLCNAEGCGNPGYPSTRGPICFSCSQNVKPRECREISHCRLSEVCYISEDYEFGDRFYYAGCKSRQLCTNIVSNLDSVFELSNSHRYTRQTTPARHMLSTWLSPTTTRSSSMPSNSSIPLTTPMSTTRIIMSTATMTTTQPSNLINLPTTPVSSLSSSQPTKATTKGGYVAVVGKRSMHRRKRFTDCTQCCYGDLCNVQCRHTNAKPLIPSYLSFSTSKSTAPTFFTTNAHTSITTTLPATVTTDAPTVTASASTTSTKLTSTTQTSTTTASVNTATLTNSSTPSLTTAMPLNTTTVNMITHSNFTSTSTTTATTTNLPTTTVLPLAKYRGSVGNEFLLAFSQHEDRRNADAISLLVTSPSAGHVSIYLPENDTYVNRTINKGSNFINIDPAITISNHGHEHKGIHVLSDVKITLHAMEYGNSSDTGFLVIPVRDLSTQYVAGTVEGTKINPSYITVVALENNTQIQFQIKLKDKSKYVYVGKYNERRYQDGEVVTIPLNQYETFQLAGASDLSGTILNSTKPIAVISGSSYAKIPKAACTSCDSQTVEQMIPPAKYLGKRFVVPKLADHKNYMYKIISMYENTNLNLSHTKIKLPTAGSWKELEGNSSFEIVSDKPILLLQLPKTAAGGVNNASGTMIVIPALKQYQSEYRFTIPDPSNRQNLTNYKSYLTLIMKENNTDIYIDNTKLDTRHSVMETLDVGSERYSIITIPINTPGPHIVRDVLDNRFGLLTYGFTPDQGYGFPVGLQLSELQGHLIG